MPLPAFVPRVRRQMDRLLSGLGVRSQVRHLGATLGRRSLAPVGPGLHNPPPEWGPQLPVGSPIALYCQGKTALLWARQLLREALASGPVFLQADDTPWLVECLAPPDLQTALDQQELTVWATTPDISALVREQGLARWLAELEQAGLSPLHTLLCTGRHDWLLQAPAAPTQTMLTEWCRQRNRPVVFLHPQQGSPQEMPTSYAALRGVFQHLALLHDLEGSAFLLLEHWVGPAGLTLRRDYGLVLDKAGENLCFDGTWHDALSTRAAWKGRQRTVLVSDWALPQDIEPPSGWARVEQHVEALKHALTEGGAATVILGLGPNESAEEFEALARLVHALRSSFPHTLQLLLRETRRSLRLYEEKVLLELGLNEVIYRDVPISRLIQKIRDATILPHTDQVPPHTHEVIQLYMPEAVSGYVAPKVFVDTVRKALEKCSRSGMHASMIRFTLLGHVRLIDAIKACNVQRQGDVMTADSEAFYLFLYACSTQEVPSVLNMVFSRQVQYLFAAQFIAGTHQAMERMLVQIQEAQQVGLADWTEHVRNRPAWQNSASPPSIWPDESTRGSVGSYATSNPSVRFAKMAEVPQATVALRPIGQASLSEVLARSDEPRLGSAANSGAPE